MCMDEESVTHSSYFSAVVSVLRHRRRLVCSANKSLVTEICLLPPPPPPPQPPPIPMFAVRDSIILTAQWPLTDRGIPLAVDATTGELQPQNCVAANRNSKHQFTTSFLQAPPQLLTSLVSEIFQLTVFFVFVLFKYWAVSLQPLWQV